MFVWILVLVLAFLSVRIETFACVCVSQFNAGYDHEQ